MQVPRSSAPQSAGSALTGLHGAGVLARMKDCFIIMPLTTPDLMVPIYSGGAKHFLLMLEHLFTPAVKDAGFNPVPPVFTGSELIHAGIVQNLEKAAMVLCDMSTLNANVFFELGIRTSLNKPVCMVKDEKTPNVPFDNSPIVYHTYDSSMSCWVKDDEVKKLSKHIKESVAGDGQNQLWKYYSLSARAQLEKGKPGENETMNLVLLEMQGLKNKVEAQAERAENAEFSPYGKTFPYWPTRQALENYVKSLAKAAGLPVSGVFAASDGRSMEVWVTQEAFGTQQFNTFMSKVLEHTGKGVVPVVMNPLKKSE